MGIWWLSEAMVTAARFDRCVVYSLDYRWSSFR